MFIGFAVTRRLRLAIRTRTLNNYLIDLLPAFASVLNNITVLVNAFEKSRLSTLYCEGCAMGFFRLPLWDFAHFSAYRSVAIFLRIDTHRTRNREIIVLDWVTVALLQLIVHCSYCADYPSSRRVE